MLYRCGYLLPHVVGQVNAAEVEFWRRSQGTRVDYSDRILGFECGGQQWVNEVSFPVGTLKEPDGRDLEYMVSGSAIATFVLVLVCVDASETLHRWAVLTLAPDLVPSACRGNILYHIVF